MGLSEEAHQYANENFTVDAMARKTMSLYRAVFWKAKVN